MKNNVCVCVCVKTDKCRDSSSSKARIIIGDYFLSFSANTLPTPFKLALFQMGLVHGQTAVWDHWIISQQE